MDEDKRVEVAGKSSVLDKIYHHGDEESEKDTYKDQEPDEFANSVNNGKVELGLTVTASTSRQQEDTKNQRNYRRYSHVDSMWTSCHLDKKEDTFEDQEPDECATSEEIGSGSGYYQENSKVGVNNGKLELGLAIQRHYQRDLHVLTMEDFIRENHYHVPDDEGKTSTSIAGDASMVLHSYLESPSDNEQDVDSGSESSWVVIDKSDLPSRLQVLLAELSRDLCKVIEALEPSDMITLGSSISTTFGGISDLWDIIQKIRSGDITLDAWPEAVSAAKRVEEGTLDMIEGGRNVMPFVKQLMSFVYKTANNIMHTLSNEVAAHYKDYKRRSDSSSANSQTDNSERLESSTDSESANTDDTDWAGSS